MRRALLWLLAGLLWGVGLWWGGLPVVPWEVTVRPAPRPGPAVLRPQEPPTHLAIAVLRTVPGLDGLAIGDAMQFDRYGVVDAVAGTAVCVPLMPGVHHPVMVTPLGGRLPHGRMVSLDLVSAAAGPECGARLPPLLSQHP